MVLRRSWSEVPKWCVLNKGGAHVCWRHRGARVYRWFTRHACKRRAVRVGIGASRTLCVSSTHVCATYVPCVVIRNRRVFVANLLPLPDRRRRHGRVLSLCCRRRRRRCRCPQVHEIARQLPGLTALNLEQCDVGDAGVRALSSLTKLEVRSLHLA